MERSYFDKMHTLGRIWSIVLLAAVFAVPIAISVRFSDFPGFKEVMGALVSVLPIFYATAVVEIITYAPLLGASGTYLSFATGNISNLKLPCALQAMENAGVRPGTDEGEVITTISIAVSAIVTTVMIAVFVLFLRPLIPYLSDETSPLSPAFKQVLPALFGALGAEYFVKHWKIGLIPMVFLLGLLAFKGTIAVGTLIPIGVVVSLVGAEVLYKTKKI